MNVSNFYFIVKSALATPWVIQTPHAVVAPSVGWKDLFFITSLPLHTSIEVMILRVGHTDVLNSILRGSGFLSIYEILDFPPYLLMWIL
jgi:hypothetical protein